MNELIKNSIHRKLLKEVNTYCFKNSIIDKLLIKEELNNLDTTIIKCNNILSYINDILKDTLISNLSKKYLTTISINSSIIEDRLDDLSYNSALTEVIDILINGNSCIVGGFIRDTLTGKENKDIDFVTNISYNKLSKMFEDKGFKVNQEGKQFLVLIVSKNNYTYEIANYRTEDSYTDNRHPDNVKTGSIEEDSNRRDFTVNALYYSLNEKIIIDLHDGLNDLDNRILKFIGTPQHRIIEDPLRGIRFYRFLSKEFKPDKKSLKAVRGSFDYIMEKTSPERIKNEIERIVGI